MLVIFYWPRFKINFHYLQKILGGRIAMKILYLQGFEDLDLTNLFHLLLKFDPVFVQQNLYFLSATQSLEKYSNF